MSAQTSYSRLQPIAYAGLLFAQAPHDIISRAVETAAGIEFGVAVGRGTDKDDQAVLGTADYLGITVRTLDHEGAANTGAIKYDQYEAVAILREGYVWAVCPAGCTPGDLVKYTTADGVLDAGAAAAGETQIDNAQWDSTAAAGQLAVIRLADISTTAGA